MSKADTLLKKATFFERIALYSDRKTFLQALAQGGGSDDWMGAMHSPYTDANIKANLDGIVAALQSWREEHGTRMVDAPGSPRLFPQSVAGAASDIMAASKYTSFNKQLLGQISQALKTLAAFKTFRDMEDDDKNAWAQSVFTPVIRSMDMINRTIQAGGTRPVSPEDNDPGPAYPGMGLHQMEGHAVPEQERPQARPTQAQWAGQLIGTLNMFAQRAKTMDDATKANTMRQLDRTTLAELARIYDNTGSSENPYSQQADQQLASQIEAAVRNFGQAFGPQAAQSANYQKLSR